MIPILIVPGHKFGVPLALLIGLGAIFVLGATGVALFHIGIMRQRPRVWVTGLVIVIAVILLGVPLALLGVLAVLA